MGIFTKIFTRSKALTTAMSGPLFGGSTKSGTSVTQESALSLSALWCGLRTISQDVGCLNPYVYSEDDNGIRIKDKKHKLTQLFKEPNPEMTGLTFRETMQFHALLWGNAYAEIVRDGSGAPVQLWLVHPQFCQVYRDSDTGTLSYRVTTSSTGGPPGNIGSQVDIQPHNMLHIPGLSPDGSVGFRLLSIARETLGFGIATQNFGAAQFRNGIRPSGTLETPNQLSDQARNNLKSSYEQSNSGADNAGKLLLLEEGLKFTQCQFTNEQTQYIEIVDRLVYEVARYLVIPPPKLFALQQATWNNITELARAYLNDCLRPWLEKWEAEIDRKLLMPSEKASKFVEFDTSTLLRADEATRYANYGVALAGQPWMSVDEVRCRENLAPMPIPEPQTPPIDPQTPPIDPQTPSEADQ
jgi:HK97 family phage portal protein